MRLHATVDAGNGDYGATAVIINGETTLEKRSFVHLNKLKCRGELVSAVDGAVAWCLQKGAGRVIVTHTYTQGDYPHCRRARLMVFT